MTTEQQTADLLSLSADEALGRCNRDVAALRDYARALWISRDAWRAQAISRDSKIIQLDDELKHAQELLAESRQTEERLRKQIGKARQELVMTGITLEDLP